jgi:hypothetical protein
MVPVALRAPYTIPAPQPCSVLIPCFEVIDSKTRRGHRMEKSVHERILELLKGMEAQKFDVVSNQKGYELSFRQSK